MTVGAPPHGGEALLETLEPGLSTTVQDAGRPGFMRVGLPQGGALDREALRLACALAAGRDAGVSPGPAALEIRYLGPTLRVRSGDVRAALAGGEASMSVRRVGGEQEKVGALRSVTLAEGDVLRVGPIRGASTATLALSGGIVAPLTLGSRATFARGGFGGPFGRALQAGDLLRVAPSAVGIGEAELWIPPERAPVAPHRAEDGAFIVRVVLGPQAQRFAPEVVDRFCSAEWVVSSQADRMGLRLEGPTLEHRGGEAGANILSEGAPEGSVQVPASGLPIVLLADRGATGGYAKIAVAASVDLPLLGRLQPGDRLRFAPASTIEARAALLQREQIVQNALQSITQFHEPGEIDEQKLWSGNLITAQTSDLSDE